MRILLTGSDGFLGWHTRVRLRALTDHEVVAVNRTNWQDLARLTKGVDAIIHCAGVNRAEPRQVEHGNVELAGEVADAARQAGSCPRIVYANSIQAGNDSAYGRGKDSAGALLAAGAADSGGAYTDVRLPNLFGEHGRPCYNSFVATFVDAVVAGQQPDIADRSVSLLHAQDAAQALIDGLTGPTRIEPTGTSTTVRGVFDTLRSFRIRYATGDLPSLIEQFEIDLFNTLRSALFPAHYPITLTTHSDARGRLVETVRSHGGQGQTFISTTRPRITRGEHFHLGKIERFVVVSGAARISLRRMLTDDVISFHVNGNEPAIIDIPTLWAHNITNTGDRDLTTMFWTHALFDPARPDTFAESVQPKRAP